MSSVVNTPYSMGYKSPIEAGSSDSLSLNLHSRLQVLQTLFAFILVKLRILRVA
jgi:hypothetical protein